MNLFKLSWKYLAAKPLSSLLSIVLVALGVSLASVLFLLNQQFKDRLYKNIEGIDLVVSAKGSPLQMILSAVYQIDAPTGNIPLKESFVVTKNPYVETAIPLAMGDTYKGYRIVGTDHQYTTHYKAVVAQGKLFEKDLEVVVGSRCAQKLGLKLGDTFYGSHGLVEDGGHVHETYAYEVVGILEEANKVIDQLILTNVASVWRMHDDHDHGDHDHDDTHDHEGHDHGDAHDHEGHDHGDAHDHEGHDHGDAHDHEGHDHGDAHDHEGHDHGDAHDHEGHDHGDAHDHEGHDHGSTTKDLAPISKEGKEVTAYLVSYKKDNNGNTSARAFVECSQIIDQFSKTMGYAKPSIQLQRLLEMTGLGMSFLKYLALIIIIISAFSMFISLYSSLKERKYEIALMRVGGASAMKVFMMIILEGLIIASVGLLFGLLISHLGVQLMAGSLEESYKYTFTGWLFLTEEVYLSVGTLCIGFLAAIVPAIQAYATDISTTLSNES
jgi:putative ABC transport system permease protein